MKVNLFLSLPKALTALILITCLTPAGLSQSTKAPTAGAEAAQVDLTLEIASLVSDLHSLERETLKFNDPLAEALAKAEIADAAWRLEQSWAKKLLRNAYELALPEADQKQNRPAGSMPTMPNTTDRARQKVRYRVLEIARRDKEFASELVQLEAERLGAYEKQFAFAVLADQSLEGGDVEATAGYILEGIKADPTQGAAPGLINGVALRDRALADRLVLHYISELRKFPISSSNQSDVRTFFNLSSLVRPYIFDPSVNREPIKVPPPGPEVMRAYIDYTLEALGILEQKEPGYLQVRRGVLLSLWLPLQQYASDLAGAFLSLESRSRRPGADSSLPTVASVEEEGRARYEKVIKEGLNSNNPHEALIHTAVSKGDFDKARKMIEKLPADRSKQLGDAVNAEEAISLAAKRGHLYEAEVLAGRLNYAHSILRVYPLLINKCAAKKDQVCVTRLTYQALRQAKSSDTSAPVAPDGIPPSAVESDRRFDPVLSLITKLSVEILPHDTELAFDLVNELVSAANARPTDAGQPQIVFDITIFKKLAPKDELRTRQTAYSLKNSLQRVLALAAIYQWKVKELSEKQPKSAKAN